MPGMRQSSRITSASPPCAKCQRGRAAGSFDLEALVDQVEAERFPKQVVVVDKQEMRHPNYPSLDGRPKTASIPPGLLP